MRSLLLAIALVMALAPCALADSVFVTSIPSDGNDAWAYDLGDSFTVGATSLTLTQAGVFDDDQDGLKAAIEWSLWKGGTVGGGGWTLVASQTFGTETGALDGNHRFLDIADVTLDAYTLYVVVANGYGSGDESYNEYAAPNTQVGYSSTDLTAGVGYYGSGTTGPNAVAIWGPFGGGAADNFGVASFKYTVGTPVPEPASIALFGLGTGLLAWCRRRRRSF